MARVEVDTTQCQQYGHCVLEAPDVFRLTDTDTLEWKPTVEPSQTVAVKRAVDACPTQAISIRD